MNRRNNRRSRGFSHRNMQSKPHKSGGFRSGPRQRYKPKKLNADLFVKKATYSQIESYTPEHTFEDFDLSHSLKKNIQKRGYSNPTAIQDQAIRPILKGKDVVGVADTGSGKTAAFLLPIITKISRDRRQRALIIAPTRELVVQIQDEFKQFAIGMKLFSTRCIGGTSITNQSYEIKRNPHVVIGTPGRIKDLEERRILDLGQFHTVVLDEVDRMLDMGFIHDVRHIISLIPTKRQSLFFSATLPEITKLIMKQFLANPITIAVKTGKTSQNVDQDVIRTNGKNKIDILHDLLIQDEFEKVLIFGRTKWGVNKMEGHLAKRGFKTASIHGNKSQTQRLKALRQVKSNQVKILLATDVASRGIDIDDITHVINFDPPESYDDYVHRIGRTGRAGKKGTALTFVD